MTSRTPIQTFYRFRQKQWTLWTRATAAGSGRPPKNATRNTTTGPLRKQTRTDDWQEWLVRTEEDGQFPSHSHDKAENRKRTDEWRWKGAEGRRRGACGRTCRKTYPSPVHPPIESVLFFRATVGDVKPQTTASRTPVLHNLIVPSKVTSSFHAVVFGHCRQRVRKREPQGGAAQLLTSGPNDDDCLSTRGNNALYGRAIERKREGVNAGVKNGRVRRSHDTAKPKKRRETKENEGRENNRAKPFQKKERK